MRLGGAYLGDVSRYWDRHSCKPQRHAAHSTADTFCLQTLCCAAQPYPPAAGPLSRSDAGRPHPNSSPSGVLSWPPFGPRFVKPITTRGGIGSRSLCISLWAAAWSMGPEAGWFSNEYGRLEPRGWWKESQLVWTAYAYLFSSARLSHTCTYPVTYNPRGSRAAG